MVRPLGFQPNSLNTNFGDKLKRVLQQKLQLHRMQPGFDTGRAEVSLWRPSLPLDITRPMRVKVVSCRTAGTSALANGFAGAESQKSWPCKLRIVQPQVEARLFEDVAFWKLEAEKI